MTLATLCGTEHLTGFDRFASRLNIDNDKLNCWQNQKMWSRSGRIAVARSEKVKSPSLNTLWISDTSKINSRY